MKKNEDASGQEASKWGNPKKIQVPMTLLEKALGPCPVAKDINLMTFNLKFN